MYDLPIALSILAATQQISSARLKDFLIAGELGSPDKRGRFEALFRWHYWQKKEGRKGILLPRESALKLRLFQESKCMQSTN